MDPIIEQLKGKLIVSCQAYMGEPLTIFTANFNNRAMTE